MGGLKEIRNRINSITSTQKITSAMKMISAAKFHKAQETLMKYRTYSNKILEVLNQVAPTINENEPSLSKWFAKPTALNSIALIVVTSNSSMCAGFNQNLVKAVVEYAPTEFGENWKNITNFYCLGKKGGDFFKKKGFTLLAENMEIVNKPDFSSTSAFMQSIMQEYLDQKYDAVYVAFNEFKNPALQIPIIKRMLPFEVPTSTETKYVESNLVFEPSKDQIMELIIPLALRTFFHEMLLENTVGEHGARMTSMHQATENAIELTKELKLQYNKARQAAITNEILEIVSGAEALKG